MPLGNSFNRTNELPRTENGFSCEIGNDAWIERDVLILGGFQIGDGAIIGMDSVVVEDVPPYSIVGGVPAVIHGKRFSDTVINKLLQIKWWDWPPATVQERRDSFSNVEEFLAMYQ